MMIDQTEELEKFNQKNSSRLLVVRSILFLSSFLLVVSAQPDKSWIVCLLASFIGYALCFYLLISLESRVTKFLVGFSWFFSIQLVQLNWLATTHYHGKVILLVYLFLVSLIAVQFALFAVILPSVRKLSIFNCLVLSVLWSLLEYSRLFYLSGFPFNSVGLALSATAPSGQLATIFGVYGLSFWVIFINLLVLRVLLSRDKVQLVLVTALFLAPIALGKIHIYYQSRQMQKADTLDIALVQTGLIQEQKWSFPEKEDLYVEPMIQWERVMKILEQSKNKNYDLIVLPEVAFPGDAFYAQFDLGEVVKQLGLDSTRIPAMVHPLAKKIKENWMVSHSWIAQALSNHYKSELVIGLVARDYFSGEIHNSAFHFLPFKKVAYKYDKRVLVPMAEYLPFPTMESFLAKYGVTQFFSHGNEVVVFEGKTKMAPSICYEEGFSHLIWEQRRDGAQLLVNISNDGWFPRSRLVQEHLNLGRLRAIENGIFSVRSCNSGGSGVIDCFGNVLKQMSAVDEDDQWVSGVIFGKISTFSYETLYSKFGDYLFLFFSTLIIALFVAQRISRRQERSN